jgi:hypothetical protein
LIHVDVQLVADYLNYFGSVLEGGGGAGAAGFDSDFAFSAEDSLLFSPDDESDFDGEDDEVDEPVFL